MILTDAVFATGRQHRVCQDYAAEAPDRVVLSDGCSSSPHTDFGARLICRAALLHGTADAATRALPLLEPLGLPLEALDATLLTAEWSPATASVRASVHGDGVIVARRRDGVVIIVEVEYPSGAPLYPSYDLDAARKARYLVEFGAARRVTTRHDDEVAVWNDTVHDGVAWTSGLVVREFFASLFDLVLVLSDGAQTFRRPVAGSHDGRTEAVPLAEVVHELLAVKVFTPSFLTRRVNRFLRDATTRGWSHDDDFSVAAVHMEAP